jgi:putative hydrolase of the HAD superfamily
MRGAGPDGADGDGGCAAAPYAALVFDLGGVIVPHDNAVLYARLAQACAPARATEIVEAIVRDPGYERGELPIAHLHERLRREAGYAPGWAEFVADWCGHLGLDTAMLDYVERLAARRRVLLFSNTNREHWEHLVRLSGGRLGRFEAHLSYEMGDAKPSLSSFRRVAARAGIAPARALFVDDRPDNVAAARQAGFHAEVFTGQDALERLLAGR